MVFRERLEGEKEIRVCFQVEETPPGSGDASCIAIFFREELDLIMTRSYPLRYLFRLKRTGGKLSFWMDVRLERSIMVMEYF